jgi:hypothetical protein
MTATEIEALLLACLKAGDIPGVETCLMRMVIVDPKRAALLYDTMRVGVEIARNLDAAP